MVEAEGFIEEETAAHSYFVPIVDMLAGVVFLLVIMLAASLLVSRPEFGQTEQMQAEIAKITKELQQAKASENRYIEPRRQARAAMGVLLTRLSIALREEGATVDVNADQGTLTIRDAALFGSSGMSLSDKGKALAQTLATGLSTQLPCLAKAAENAPACAVYGGARLDTASITMPSNAANSARAEALQLLSAVAAAKPQLLTLQAPDGTGLMTYGVDTAAAPTPGGSSTQTQGTNTVSQSGANATPTPAVTLHFQMNVPAIP